MSHGRALGQTVCCAQIGLGPLVATSTSNKVAVLRTLAAIVVSGSDTDGYWSASASSLMPTL